MSRALYVLFLSVFSLSTFANDLDLSTALQEVVGDSPSLQASKSRAVEADWKKTEALGTGFLPKLRANGTYLTEKKYQFINVSLAGGIPTTIPQIIPNSQFNLIAELPLFNGFVSSNRLSAAQKNSDAAQEKYEWETFRTEMNVTLAFYQALASKLLRDVAIQNLKVLDDHKKQAQLFRKGGLSTNYDVLRVEVQASNAKTDLADAEDAIVISRQRLAEIMGHEEEMRDLAGVLPIPKEHVINQDTGKFSERKDIKALRLETEARKDEERADNRYWVPEFSLFGQYTFYNNLSLGLNDYDAYRNARQVGLFMTWNLFDGLASHSRAQQSIQRKVQTEKALRATELAANKDVGIWSRRYRSQCRIYEARVEDIKRSEESVRLATEGKRVGARTDSELLDAELDLSRSRADAVRAQLAAAEALINLQLAEGRRY